MTEIAIVNQPKYLNKSLTRATEKIRKLDETVRKSSFEAALIVAAVGETKCYEEDGFKNVAEWCEAAFGWKKSTTYNMARIGTDYLQIPVNANGKKLPPHTIFTGDKKHGDYGIAQLVKMLPAGVDAAIEMHDTGVINPAMSAREIEKAVKARLKGAEECAEEPAEDGAEEPAEDGAEDVTVYITVRDNNGNTYLVPEQVLSAYKQ